MTVLARLFLLSIILFISVSSISAQEAEDRTLLSHDEMRAIINESSGERALHHVLELVPYPRVRPDSEYENTFRETDVLVKFLNEYGYSEVNVESFPSNGELWQPSQGELWMVEPEVRKLYDIFDIAVSLAGNSEPGDVTAEVVDVGVGGRSSDYEGKDLEGKIVLGSARASTLQRNALAGDAVGVVSYNSIRYDDYPDQILSTSISSNAPEGKSPGFGWAISPREAREIQRLLNNGQKVVLRSIVKAKNFPNELEVIHATIPGDGSTDQVVGISAHVYEGYIKMGANDDNSGTGLILEMGRAYIRLINEGKLPRPKRTIHFLWVPEISGTNAWLNKHTDIKERMIADLNFDMEGIRLSTSRAYWVLHRTPDTFPSFINDVSQSFMEFVSETNRERVRFRANGYRPSLPVFSHNGSRDPFYIKIDKHYGASDHVIYMQHGIPSVMFITWPDMWYHSSQDIPQQLDPTQLRRAAVVGIGAMSVLASAGDEMAMKVAGETITRGSERMGEAQRKGLSYMADLTEADGLHQAYKDAQNTVLHQAMVERATVMSSAVLFDDPEEGEDRLEPLAASVDGTAEGLQQSIAAYYALRAEHLGTRVQPLSITEEETRAASMVVKPGEASSGGWRARRQAFMKLAPADRAKLGVIPQHMTSELTILMGQGKSVLEIRNFLSGEFEPVKLSDIIEYVSVLEKVDLVKLESR